MGINAIYLCFQIERRCRRSQTQSRYIFFGLILKFFYPFRRPSRAYNHHARSQRIESSRMPHLQFFLFDAAEYTQPYALDHIERHIGDSLTLTDIAAAACVSRFHFARLFRVSTGQSPMEFVLAKRIALAPPARTPSATAWAMVSICP